MLKATLVITDEAISVSMTEADVVTLAVTQGTSLWEADGEDHIKPKGGKTVDAPYLELGGKVDKVTGYGLSQNDFTDALETKLTDLPLASELTSALAGKVDVVAGKELSDNNYTDAEVVLVSTIPDKVDKVSGKELSDNNYTDAEVIKVGYIDGTGSGDMFLSDDGDYKLTPLISGFTNKNTVGVSYDSSTRKITLSGSFKAYYAGEEVTTLTNGWVSDAHADVAGVYYLYYDGTFHFDTTPWNLQTIPKQLPIAYTVYDGVKFGLRECHGFQDGESHFNAHRNLGTTKYSGGSISNVTTGSTTAANRRPYISETVIADEDLFTTLPALTTNAYSIRYLTGANTRTFSVDQTDIVPLNGNIPYWNQFTGGSWTQTPMTNNYYAAVFVAAMPVSGDTTSQKLRYLFVQPQTQSSSLATIQGLTPSSVSLGDSTMLSAEYVFTHKIIIQYVGPSTNNWVITSVTELTGTKVQQIAISPAPTVASNVTFTPAGNIAATNVQTAIEELDTEKELSSNKKLDLTDNSDTYYPSQKAVKTAVDAKLSSNGSANDLTFTDTNSHFTTDEVGEGLVQLGVEVDALELLARPNKSRVVIYESDFLSATSAAIAGAGGAANGSGTAAISTLVSAAHPGVVLLSDSTTANGGYYFMSHVSAFLLAGGESSEWVFNLDTGMARTTAVVRMGFHDQSVTSSEPTDGAWINIVGDGTKATISGKTANNTSTSTTSSTYTADLSTWYRCVVSLNSNATAVSFYLYNASGTQLWTDTLSANIPTGASRQTGWGVIAGQSTTDAAAPIIHLDYCNMTIDRTLVR